MFFYITISNIYMKIISMIKYNEIRYDANFYSLTSSMFSCLRPLRDEVEDITGTGEWLYIPNRPA